MDRIITVSKPQHEMLSDESRFKIAICGRRFGKTYYSKIEALRGISKPNQKVIYVAPTYTQAKDIFWNELKDIVPQEMILKTVESTPQTIFLKNGSSIAVHGSKNYNNLRGQGYDLAILDEVQDQKQEIWTEVIRPALSDRLGRAIMIGTPKGFNWVYDITKNPDFKYFQYTTREGGWVTDEELKSAMRSMDERTFKQEYEASFENATGLVYYAYGEHNHKNIEFSSSAKTHLCWDFNVNPMSCLINQQQPNGTWCYVKEFSHRDSNTEYTALSVDRFLKSKSFSGELTVTGDASGVSMRSSASFSDWEIIEKIFKNYNRYSRKVRRTERIKDRVAALNAILQAADGTITQYINHVECPVLINDFNRVLWASDGERLDDAHGKLTHMSDAASYDAYNFHTNKYDYKIERV